MKIAVTVVDNAGERRAILNLALGLMTAGLLVWYVVWANHLGSFSYQENIFKTRLAELNEENQWLLTEKLSAADLSSLFAFVRRSGLVEQKNIEYVFNEKDVAQAEGLSR